MAISVYSNSAVRDWGRDSSYGGCSVTREQALADVKFWHEEVALAKKEVANKEASVEDAQAELDFALMMLREAIDTLEDFR